jgi:hypothetical protein
VAEPPLGHPNIFPFFFCWFFGFLWILFFKNKTCDGGILGEKMVKVIELLQFESLERLSVTFETFEVKVKING